MNACEVIDQIKAMPPEEQAKVLDFIEEVKALLRDKEGEAKNFAAAADWFLRSNHRPRLKRSLTM